MVVYTLSFLRPLQDDGTCAAMFIGVYTSVREVEAAKERLRKRPAFGDHPDGFQVDCIRVNEDYDHPEWLFTPWPRGQSESPTPPP